ncbi:MAG: hypothetical protein ABI542_11825 [Gemmatimonadota bacterium]
MQLQFARTVLAGAALVAGLAIVTPSTASAQMGFVLQADYNSDVDFGVGAGVNFGLGSLTAKQGIRGEATFDYYFPGNGNTFGSFDANYKYWELNGNLMMDIKSVKGLYVGAGVNYAHSSYDFNGCGVFCDGFNGSNGDVALNLLSGYSFGGNKSPFVQGKIELGHGSPFIVTGGIRF